MRGSGASAEVRTLCYAMVFPGRKSGFRAGLRLDSLGKTSESAADYEVFPMRIRPTSGPEVRFLARKQYCVT